MNVIFYQMINEFGIKKWRIKNAKVIHDTPKMLIVQCGDHFFVWRQPIENNLVKFVKTDDSVLLYDHVEREV